MNKQILEGNWKQARGRAKEMWGKLTDDEIERTEGNYDQLVGCVQKKYGYTLEESQKKVGDVFEKISKKIKE